MGFDWHVVEQMFGWSVHNGYLEGLGNDFGRDCKHQIVDSRAVGRIATSAWVDPISAGETAYRQASSVCAVNVELACVLTNKSYMDGMFCLDLTLLGIRAVIVAKKMGSVRQEMGSGLQLASNTR